VASGTLYLVDAQGQLLYFKHDSHGRFTVSGQVIGTGWGGFTRVVSGGTNAFYVQNGDGNLRYYYHDDSYRFVVSNKVIGTGWNFKYLASAGNGEVYGVDDFGDLLFYRHDSKHRWIDGSGSTIGIGFANPGKYRLIVAAR
jgi:hypothetical protein